jgi:hypothetical protein
MRPWVPAGRRAGWSRLVCGFLMLPLLVVAACTGDSGKADSDSSTTTANTRPLPTRVTDAGAPPGADDRVVVSGNLTLDGKPFDARFLGAVVRRQGLVTPCQFTIPRVEQGRYAITVLADAESFGCGAPGAEILLWAFVHERFVYSSSAVGWPASRHSVTFDASLSTSKPRGDVPATAQFNGELLARDGTKLPPGARVEAYVGPTRCGIASTRRSGGFAGYVLAVVGPDSIPGCERGATLTFRVNGKPAVETSRNDLSIRGQGLDLTQR